jgi:hypothetical protein
MEISTLTKAEQMCHHITQCGISNNTVASYCAEHGLSIATYYYWHQKLKEVKKSIGFIELHPSVSSSRMEISLPNGIRIHFDQLVPVSYLKEIVCFI